MADGGDVGSGVEDRLGEQESRDQIEVVAGCSQRHRHRLLADADFQRFFHGKDVVRLGRGIEPDPTDARLHGRECTRAKVPMLSIVL